MKIFSFFLLALIRRLLFSDQLFYFAYYARTCVLGCEIYISVTLRALIHSPSISGAERGLKGPGNVFRAGGLLTISVCSR